MAGLGLGAAALAGLKKTEKYGKLKGKYDTLKEGETYAGRAARGIESGIGKGKEFMPESINPMKLKDQGWKKQVGYGALALGAGVALNKGRKALQRRKMEARKARQARENSALYDPTTDDPTLNPYIANDPVVRQKQGAKRTVMQRMRQSIEGASRPKQLAGAGLALGAAAYGMHRRNKRQKEKKLKQGQQAQQPIAEVGDPGDSPAGAVGPAVKAASVGPATSSALYEDDAFDYFD